VPISGVEKGSPGRERSMKSLPQRVTMDWDFWTIGNEPWKCILDHSVGPTRNATSEDAATRYLVDPLEFLQVQKWAEQRELDICGFYHSHPDFSAVPSEYDQEFAWEGYLYLIFSVKDGVFEESRAWRWDAVEERFKEVFSPTTI